MMRRMKRAACLAVFLIACAPSGNARFQVREGVEQLHVTHAEPGAQLAVFDAAGNALATGTADALGSFMFRKLPPGSGYTVHTIGTARDEYSRPLTVKTIAESKPEQSFYA